MRRGPSKSASILGLLVIGASGIPAPCLAAAKRPARVARLQQSDAPTRLGAASSPAARAPAGSPLLTTSGATGEEGGEQEARSFQAQADPLVSNGLGSPTCRSRAGAELDAEGRRDCETSGFVAAPAPTGNYGIDVHIDTGLLGVSSGGLLSIVQDLFVTPLWLAMVWAVHALVVMLEWCFALDLLDGGSGAGLQALLRGAEAGLTAPLLAVALSVASVLSAYHGIVRRRISGTIGEALVMGTMIAGGLWLILDPAGTVGSLGRLSDEAGLGTMAVAVGGSPALPGRALGRGTGAVFASAIEAPWCYLEFGDVDWCQSPARLDRQLKDAGVRIAAREQAQAGCPSPAAGCEGGQARDGKRLAASARLLREARTNGALFLALPANGPDRNSINQTGSLLRALCGTSEATNCRGATASEAEFRTNGGTWPRVGGLLLVGVGLLGMLLLLGYIAMRLLMAAVLSFFYLLLAPGVVLMPAFGERGRALFRGWAVRLFGAVLSKLIFAFLLGVALAVMTLLHGLSGLGWWARWLLMSAFWWGAFIKREHWLTAASLSTPSPQPGFVRRTVVSLEDRRQRNKSRRELGQLLGTARALSEARDGGAAAGVVGAAREGAASSDGERSGERDRMAPRALAARRDAARGRREVAPKPPLAKRAQLDRIARAWEQANRSGDRRKARTLEVRRARVEGEIERDSGGIERAGRGEAPAQVGGSTGEFARFVDQQLKLPDAGTRARDGVRRDYPSLAPLVGYTRRQYEALDPASQRSARLEIDRELAAHRSRPLGDGSELRHAGGVQGWSSDEQPDSGTPIGDGPVAGARGPRPKARPQQDESPVMRDAREVAEGRKRQLGIGRP